MKKFRDRKFLENPNSSRNEIFLLWKFYRYSIDLFLDLKTMSMVLKKFKFLKTLQFNSIFNASHKILTLITYKK